MLKKVGTDTAGIPLTDDVDTQINQEDAIKYWSSTAPTVDGMLGGFPQVSSIDLRGSLAFLTKLQRASKQHPTTKLLTRVVDCGAGIGRITTGLLVDVAETVDIVEPVKEFTDRFEALEEYKVLKEKGKIGDIIVQGLQTWTPVRNYSVIWNQWCLCQLKDKQVIDYLRRCTPYLEPGGWIITKENVLRGLEDQDEFDKLDSSVLRSETKFKHLFEEAGLKIVATQYQKGFPADLYPVRMWALQAK
ncbi:hypothetical protein EJ05DRAFT_119047 [Pseudovirgaria hyperparasitica]|uniref:Alpha N-terminal protein methyltransferase 1 n=1 Tax=Pseudovirgaria hyperparasitica TaxID=470096 RepID=A0A6A6W0B2_9PEZI|nr:uncharacterized protein EJ05DRAFT_119047 [Pseudovirgaria hyperparasitica]KAF2755017.1 hypothetical protein EJ05DRAFT_119047 [Pseudovirgaria hyperparasitica]